MGQCWRVRDKRKECALSSCCYDATQKALFEYWKYANGPEWKAMVEEELMRERFHVQKVKKAEERNQALRELLNQKDLSIVEKLERMQKILDSYPLRPLQNIEEP